MFSWNHVILKDTTMM